MHPQLLDVSGIECEEAMMCIRHVIRSQRMCAGSILDLTTRSRPFLSLLTTWANSLDHAITLVDVPEGHDAEMKVRIVLS